MILYMQGMSLSYIISNIKEVRLHPHPALIINCTDYMCLCNFNKSVKASHFKVELSRTDFCCWETSLRKGRETLLVFNSFNSTCSLVNQNNSLDHDRYYSSSSSSTFLKMCIQQWTIYIELISKKGAVTPFIIAELFTPPVSTLV